MKIIDKGSGTPVVLVPGIQGRWEWMQPAVEALSKRCRVITFSLADEKTSGASFDKAAGFDCFVDQVEEALDTVGVPSAVICGISYGGLIAATFAARHPDRVLGVVAVSAPSPSWRPDARAAFLIRAPRLLSPVFCINSVRLFKEMVVAREGVPAALRFAVGHVGTVIRYRFSPTLMAQRIRLLEQCSLEAEISQVRSPALVITGEPGLDRVVPVSQTREYLRVWPQATAATIERAGHLGPISRPDVFADLVVRFADAASQHHNLRRRSVG